MPNTSFLPQAGLIGEYDSFIIGLNDRSAPSFDSVVEAIGRIKSFITQVF
jgi:hypothetical protein